MKAKHQKKTPNGSLPGTRTPNRAGAGSSPAATHFDSNPLLIADWVRKRRAARFLARLRRAVLPLALILVAGGASAMVTRVEGDNEGASATERENFGFLRMTAPKQEFYVGELVPVELKACFRAGVELRVDGLPRLNGDAFTMNKLGDHPQRSQQIIGGVPYTVFTWSTAITAVKAGDYEMSVELPTTVTLRQRAQRPRARTGSPFGDSFFDEVFNDSFFQDFFGTAAEKEVSLSSRPHAVKILSLPSEKRPSGFTGAVGKFDVAAEAAPTVVTAGDPVTVTFKVSGSGNFDRVSLPASEADDVWKTYKASSRFEPADNAATAGTKTFEQAWVPTRAGRLEIPAVTFSFFDPEKKEYTTRTTLPIPIEVTPGQNVSVGARSGPDVPAPASVTAPDPLLPGNSASRLRAWIISPWFMAAAFLLTLVLFVTRVLIRRQQRRACDPGRHRAEETRRSVQAQLKLMEKAAEQGEAADFLAAARGALQQKLGLRWGLPPQAITLAEINARMNGAAEGFRFVFEIADEVAYTGLKIPAADLSDWSKIVTKEINRLEEP